MAIERNKKCRTSLSNMTRKKLTVSSYSMLKRIQNLESVSAKNPFRREKSILRQIPAER